MNKTELLALAEQLETDAHGLARIDFDDVTPGMREAAAILRNLAALEPVAMVRVGLSATEIRFINQPRESTHLYKLTGIIDHE